MIRTVVEIKNSINFLFLITIFDFKNKIRAMKNIKIIPVKIFLLVICFMQLQVITLHASVPMLLRLNAAGNSMQNQTTVYFDANGSFNYNSENDAPSLGVDPGYLNIISRFDSIDYQIKCLPLLTQSISIPIKVMTGLSGVYQIYGSDMQNLPAGACIQLHDNFTNTNQDLRLGSYTCTIIDTESVTRFVINISISALSISSSFMNPACSSSGDGYISASGLTGTAPWNYYWKDSVNNIIKTSLLKTTADTLFEMNAGAYRVDITSNGTCANGTVIFYLQGTQSPEALFTSSTDDEATFSQAVSFTNNSTKANNYWWDFGDGTGTNDANPSHYYVSVGTFIATLTAFGSTCADSSIYSKEITITNQTTAIKQIAGENKNMLISRDASGYYVKFNYNTKQDVAISVSDLLGQQVTHDFEVKGILNEKIYVNTSKDENQVLIVSVISTSGEKIYKKIIN